MTAPVDAQVEPCASPQAAAQTTAPVAAQVLVCQYDNCRAQGSAQVLAAFQAWEGITAQGSECQGQCNLGPTVRILADQTWYCRVKVEDVAAIATQHLAHQIPVQSLLHPRFHPPESL